MSKTQQTPHGFVGTRNTASGRSVRGHQSILVVQIQQVVSEYRVPHQVYDNREEDVLRFGNDKNVVERVAPIPVDVFNASINDRVAEQLVGRNRGNIGPYVDRNGTWRADFEARPAGTAQ